MKKFGIISLSLLLMILCSVPVPATESARPDIPYILDTAKLFTPKETLLLTDACLSAEAESGVGFMIATTTRTLWGEDILYSYGLSDSADLVILIITLEYGTYYYDLYTYGRSRDRISDREVDLVLDDPAVYDNLKSGNLFDGSLAFTEKAAKAIQTSNLAPSNFTPSFYLWVLVPAVILSFIICISVFASYKKKKRSTGYPLDVYTKLNVTDRQDVFVGSYVTKHRISSSSGGGRSSGGGGRGGGGGHRCGR